MKLRDLLKLRRVLKTTQKTKEKIVATEPVLGKGLLRSKTFWVNLLTALVTIGGTVSGISFFPESFVPYLAGGLAIANIFLRMLTDQPITGVK